MQQETLNIPAVILAGGEGSRMGNTDKCLLEIGGLTILERVVESLSQQTGQIFLNANSDVSRFKRYQLPIICDQFFPSAGPLAGITSVLLEMKKHNHPASWLLSVASDCPFIPTNLMTKLAAAREPGRQVIYSFSNGRDHFVIALWSTSLLKTLCEYLDRGDRSVGKFIASHNGKRVEFEHQPLDPFFNINTPPQWQQAQKMLQGN